VPTTTKARKSGSPPSSSRSARSASTRKRNSANGRRPANASGRQKVQAQKTTHRDGIGDAAGSLAQRARHGAGAVATGAAIATLGTAAAALAGRALILTRTRRKRVFGVAVPRRHTSVKSIAKHVADMAEQLEHSSLDVSKASHRAKQAAKVLS
jgi:hypothetical protein